MRYGYLYIFQNGGRRHLGFLKLRIANGRDGQDVRNASPSQIWSKSDKRGRDMVIFRFFKMAAAAILDFENLKFLTTGAVKRVELHHRAKFRQNRPNCG